MLKKQRREDAIERDQKTICREVHRLADGDLEIDKMTLESHQYNELASDMVGIAAELNEYVREIARVLSHLSVGDLCVKVSEKTEFKGDFMPIRTALIKLVDSLHMTFTETTEVMNEMNRIGEITNVASKTVATNEARIADRILLVDNKCRDLSEKADANTKNISSVSQSIQKVRENVTQGSTYVSNLVESMEQVEVASYNISGVTELILSISSQTKLLALNASIEAARAGVHGRGFAVVADEIGKLALQTTNAVTQTSELIQKSLEKVGDCKTEVEHTAGSFDSIKSNIKIISEESKAIVETTMEQKTDIEEIVAAIEEVSKTIQNNATIAEDNAKANASLYKQTGKLKTLLDAYVLEPGIDSAMDQEVLIMEANTFLRKAQDLIDSIQPNTVMEWDKMLLEAMGNKECIECAYVTNSQGIQCSSTVMNPVIDTALLYNFKPAVAGDSHKSKKYYTQPMRKKDKVYVSHEYISSATKNLCCTCAKYIRERNGEEYVVSVDMKY